MEMVNFSINKGIHTTEYRLDDNEELYIQIEDYHDKRLLCKRKCSIFVDEILKEDHRFVARFKDIKSQIWETSPSQGSALTELYIEIMSYFDGTYDLGEVKNALVFKELRRYFKYVLNKEDIRG